jgi:hypothetical protein
MQNPHINGKSEMKTSFSFIFWGLIFIVINISINRFDLLPDGVGYVLIAVGCRRLAKLSPCFTTAQILSWVLAVLWLVDFIDMPRDAAVIYGLATTVVRCIMMWMLLGGIMHFAMNCARIDLAQRASNRRMAYVVLAAFAASVGLVGKGLGELAGPLVLIAVVVGLVIMVMILHLIYRVRAELANP